MVVVARAIVVVASPIAPPCAPANAALARAFIGFTVAAPLVARLELVDAIDRVVTARVFVIVVAYMESINQRRARMWNRSIGRAIVTSRGGARARKRGNAFPHTRVCCSDTWHGMGGVPLVCLRFV